MSVRMDWADPDSKPDQIAGDRRADRRYEIGLDTRWKLVRRGKVLDEGVGRVVDISSGGIRFDAGRVLPVGLNVVLTISWPILLYQVAPLQLVVTGRIVRSKGKQAAISKTQHEFQCISAPADDVMADARLMTSVKDASRANTPVVQKFH